MELIEDEITECTEDIRVLKEKLNYEQTKLGLLTSVQNSERIFVMFISETDKQLFFNSIESLKFWLIKYGYIDDTRYSEFTNFSEIENWMKTAKRIERISLDIFTDIVKVEYTVDIRFPVIRLVC